VVNNRRSAYPGTLAEGAPPEIARPAHCQGG
jgi:hypothetical protein